MTIRDEDAQRAGRTIGGQLNMGMTGDPGADGIAEYIAVGWLLTDDYYAEDDEPRTTGGIIDCLVSDLGKLSNALDALVKDLDSGNITLDSLRRMPLAR